ncbi:MAG: hypothetical protein RR197_04050, partial [Oscillospiraceae bacterium]
LHLFKKCSSNSIERKRKGRLFLHPASISVLCKKRQREDGVVVADELVARFARRAGWVSFF